jgi:SAM-dependent methyltransferase
MTVQVCERCGYVEMPDIERRAHVRTVVSRRRRSRGRAADRQDRELGMALLAVGVLDRPDLSVVICGYGRSAGNRRVARLAAVARVVGQDITAISDDREFVGDGPSGGERFDVVVAADIVERFTDPHAGFAKIFGLVAPDGVLICSMRVYDSHDLEHQRHRFGRTHASHYTPKSLRRLAAAHNQFVDFRLPAREPHAAKRQRYVIFARSQTVMESVSDYFGRHRFAPPDDSAPAVV